MILNRNDMAFKIGQDVWDLIYPVGSIYLSMNATHPSTLFGGTWQRLEGRFLYCEGSNNLLGGQSSNTSAETTSTSITIDQLPVHNHSAWLNNGGDHTHTMWFGGGANTGDGGQIPVASQRWGTDTAGMTTGWHDHGGVGVGNTGSGQGHSHQVAYIQVAAWYRTA